jgi:hypothetical protein
MYENQEYTFSAMHFYENIDKKMDMHCANFKLDIMFECFGGPINEVRTLFFTTPDSKKNQMYYLFDPFTDRDDTTNPTWYTSKPEDWYICGDGGPCYCGHNTWDESNAVTGESHWSNYTVEVEAKLIDSYVYSNPASAQSYLIFRYLDDRNFYMMQVRNGMLTLGAMVDGLYRSSVSEYISVQADTWYRYKVVLHYDEVFGYVYDGNTLLQEIYYSDKSGYLQPYGKAGVRVNSSMVRYDNFRITICDLDSLNTPTAVPTPKKSYTASPTVTPYISPTPTETPKKSYTPTPTITPNVTSTPTETPKKSYTPTPTITPNVTSTPTETPKKNYSPTPIPTDTPIPTVTPIPTPTPYPTNTPLPTPTDTPKKSPTPYMSPTPTETPKKT